MNLEKNREIIGGSIFFLCSAAYFVIAFSIKQYQDGILSSDFIPKVYGLILMVLSAFQILLGVWFHNKKTIEEATPEQFKDRIASVVYTFTLLLLYVLLLKPIGFVIMSTVFIFAMTLLLYPKEIKEKSKAMHLTKIVVIAVIFSTAVYLFFVWGFALTLPAGILG